MANKRFWLVMLVVALIFGMTVVGCDDESGNDPNNDPGSENYKANWLFAGIKYYKVTDGVAGSIDYEYDVTYTSYTDDRHYNYQCSYTVNINETNSTYSQVGSRQVSYNYSINGNTSQSTSHFISDITYTYTNGTQTRNTSDTTETTTTVYDAESGLTLSETTQNTGTSNGNLVNSEGQQQYTIELLSTEGDVKTYKHTRTGYTSNLETSYDYKIQNGFTLEVRSYTADGTLSSTYVYTRTYPDDPIIKKKLPTHYNSTTSISGSLSLQQTIELVSDSNTELRVLRKNYSSGVLSQQYEQTYRPR
jgi:hypothetical protein